MVTIYRCQNLNVNQPRAAWMLLIAVVAFSLVGFRSSGEDAKRNSLPVKKMFYRVEIDCTDKQFDLSDCDFFLHFPGKGVDECELAVFNRDFNFTNLQGKLTFNDVQIGPAVIGIGTVIGDRVYSVRMRLHLAKDSKVWDDIESLLQPGYSDIPNLKFRPTVAWTQGRRGPKEESNNRHAPPGK